MKQMNIRPELIVELELSDIEENKMFNLLKPVVFEDDKLFCCLLGSDLRFGIKGFGHTPEEAIEDWEISLRKRITSRFENDEVAGYAIDILKSSTHYAAAG
jgi:hypothetical protein